MPPPRDGPAEGRNNSCSPHPASPRTGAFLLLARTVFPITGGPLPRTAHSASADGFDGARGQSLRTPSPRGNRGFREGRRGPFPRQGVTPGELGRPCSPPAPEESRTTTRREKRDGSEKEAGIGMDLFQKVRVVPGKKPTGGMHQERAPRRVRVPTRKKILEFFELFLQRGSTCSLEEEKFGFESESMKRIGVLLGAREHDPGREAG